MTRRRLLSASLALLSLLAIAVGRSLLSAGPAPQFQIIPAAKISDLTPSIAGTPSYPGKDWARSHGDHASSRYSTLRQINRSNVKNLQVAWTYRSGDGTSNIESNPIVINGIMYAPTAGHHVVAVNAATGEEIWRFKPEGRPAYRGLLYWPGNSSHKPRLYFSSGESLYAVEASSGKPVAGFGRNGRVPARGVVAPSFYREVVILPCWNVVRAFDIVTGRPRWDFHLIPRKGEYGHETWSAPGYGANTWAGMALDEARGIAYVSAGSPHPNYLGMNHRGDNLFANSVVAFKAETGERLWHFQEIRHDIWDLDIASPPNLVTVTRGGRRYDAVAQVTKIGNTLLLDRLTGKPLFPVRLRRAPDSTLEVETTARYQPDIELPQPFSRQVFSLDDVTDLSPASRAFVLDRISGADFGWFAPFRSERPLVYYGMHGGAEWMGAAFDPASSMIYVTANHLPWMVNIVRAKLPPRRDSKHMTAGHKTYLQYCAGCHGVERDGASPGPPLFSLATSRRVKEEQIPLTVRNGRGAMPPIPFPPEKLKALVDFLYDRDQPVLAESQPPERYLYRFNGYSKLLDQDQYPGVKPPWGTLNAVDLNTGRLAWQVPLGEYEELTRKGIPTTGSENFGGATVTAGGLVFAAGTRDLRIRAFDSRTGEELWGQKLPFGGFAPASTYEAGGRQFVVIAATGGGKLGGISGDAYVAFALPE